MQNYTNIIPGNKYDLMIAGSDSELEASLLVPADKINYCMIICHPNSSDGGSMDNKVVTTIMRACNKLNIISLRFNFRSVGKSKGEYDFGEGEQRDLQAIINWVKNMFPNCKILLSGFSFGSFVAHRISENYNLHSLILIAPAVTIWDYSRNKEPSCPLLIVHGTDDEIISLNDVEKWAEDLNDAMFMKVYNSCHFFHGKLIELQSIVMKFLDSVIN
ncbi:MAG: dienelactone hydrolase family protein [Legionellales bacterium]|nr:dienelactone hydrolase family protein [Legionellales bacterium]